MAFRLRIDKTIERSVQDIAGEQIDRAIAEIDDPSISRDEAIHQVRKRCKKLRGLVRLIRPQFDRYAQENTCFRDAARSLSGARDSAAMLEAFDALMKRAGGNAHVRFAGLRRAIESHVNTAQIDDGAITARLEVFKVTMRLAHARVRHWSIAATEFDAVAGGLEKTYSRGRRALRQVIGEPTTANLHEWRKRAKYHWYHVRLLADFWPSMMQSRADVLSELSDLLGDDHDLAVLRAQLIEAGSVVAEFQHLDQLIELIDRHRVEFQSDATCVGGHVYAEKPRVFVRRLRNHWKVSCRARATVAGSGHAAVTTISMSHPPVEKSDAS